MPIKQNLANVQLTQNTQDQLSNRLLPIQEAADQNGVHRNTIWNLIRAGQLPAVRLGKRIVRVRESDLAKLFTDYKAGEFGKWS